MAFDRQSGTGGSSQDVRPVGAARHDRQRRPQLVGLGRGPSRSVAKTANTITAAPGLATRAISANVASRSGMWTRTSRTQTRSTLASGSGSDSARARTSRTGGCPSTQVSGRPGPARCRSLRTEKWLAVDLGGGLALLMSQHGPAPPRRARRRD